MKSALPKVLHEVCGRPMIEYVLDAARAKEFAALVADRRGDVLLAQGKKDDARTAYQAAYKAMDEKLDYRRLIEAKLTALAAPPAPAASTPGAAK